MTERVVMSTLAGLAHWGGFAMAAQNGTEGEPHWSQRAVSWGQLIIALLATIGSLVAFAIANEQRLTRLEERVAVSMAVNNAQDERYYKTVARRDDEYAKLRSDVSAKLDRIEADVTAIKVAISALRGQR